MRWGAYYEVRDTDNVILVDCEKSYVLLEKMIKFWSDALETRRIHLAWTKHMISDAESSMDLHG